MRWERRLWARRSAEGTAAVAEGATAAVQVAVGCAHA